MRRKQFPVSEIVSCPAKVKLSPASVEVELFPVSVEVELSLSCFC